MVHHKIKTKLKEFFWPNKWKMLIFSVLLLIQMVPIWCMVNTKIIGDVGISKCPSTFNPIFNISLILLIFPTLALGIFENLFKIFSSKFSGIVLLLIFGLSTHYLIACLTYHLWIFIKSRLFSKKKVLILIFLLILPSVYSITDSNISNNVFSKFINVVESKDFEIKFRPYALGEGDKINDFNDAVIKHSDFINKTYSLADEKLTITQKNTTIEALEFFKSRARELDPCYINLYFGVITSLEGLTVDRVAGIIPDNFFFLLGYNYSGLFCPTTPRVVLSAESSTTTSAHEIGHTIGLCDEYDRELFKDQDRNRTSEDGGCPNGDSNEDGLLDDGCLDTVGPFRDGCLVENESIIIDVFFHDNPPVSLINLYGSRSSQNRRWINLETYTHLMNSIDQFTPIFSPDEVAIISGNMDRDLNASFNSFYTQDSGMLSVQKEYDEGNVILEVINNSNDLIFNLSINFTFTSGSDNGTLLEVNETPFLIFAPAKNVKRYILKNNDTGEILADKNVTPNTPTITVNSPNGGEVYNTSFNVTWSASDLDGDDLLYAVLISDDGGDNYTTIAYDVNDSFYTLNDNGFTTGSTYVVKVLATDGVNTGRDISNGNFTIIQTNVPPVLDFIGNRSVQVNSTINIQLNASDADNDTLTYSKNVSFGSIDSSTGIFTWTPPQVGNFTVNFSVSDGIAQDSEIITIEVRPILNFPPVLAPIGDRTAFVFKELIIDADATDPDNDPLTYGTDANDVEETMALLFVLLDDHKVVSFALNLPKRKYVAIEVYKVEKKHQMDFVGVM